MVKKFRKGDKVYIDNLHMLGGDTIKEGIYEIAEINTFNNSDKFTLMFNIGYTSYYISSFSTNFGKIKTLLEIRNLKINKLIQLINEEV